MKSTHLMWGTLILSGMRFAESSSYASKSSRAAQIGTGTLMVPSGLALGLGRLGRGLGMPQISCWVVESKQLTLLTLGYRGGPCHIASAGPGTECLEQACSEQCLR